MRSIEIEIAEKGHPLDHRLFFSRAQGDRPGEEEEEEEKEELGEELANQSVTRNAMTRAMMMTTTMRLWGTTMSVTIIVLDNVQLLAMDHHRSSIDMWRWSLVGAADQVSGLELVVADGSIVMMMMMMRRRRMKKKKTMMRRRRRRRMVMVMRMTTRMTNTTVVLDGIPLGEVPSGAAR
jgi:hypothetical protein